MQQVQHTLSYILMPLDGVVCNSLGGEFVAIFSICSTCSSPFIFDGEVIDASDMLLAGRILKENGVLVIDPVTGEDR